MKIGVIGSGNMGRTLGAAWAELGHEICFGGRTIQAGQEAAELAGRGTAGGSAEDAVRFGNVLLYTLRDVPSGAGLKPDSFKGKIVVDLNNAEIPPGFAYEPVVTSHAERVQADVPDARVVKAFNNLAQEAFEWVPSLLRDRNVATFLAGNDEQARGVVAGLATELGLKPIDCGVLRHARLIETHADLVRLLMIDRGFGPMMYVSVDTLPAATTKRFGGRRASSYK